MKSLNGPYDSESFTFCLRIPFSTSVRALLMYATEVRSVLLSPHCDRIADNPNGEASVTNSVVFVLSKYDRTDELISTDLTALKACS